VAALFFFIWPEGGLLVDIAGELLEGAAEGVPVPTAPLGSAPEGIILLSPGKVSIRGGGSRALLLSWKLDLLVVNAPNVGSP